MSNQQTIRDLLSKWNKWPDNKDVLSKKWVEIFSQLKEIRKWNIQDRLRETGIEKYWKEELEIKKGTARTYPIPTSMFLSMRLIEKVI